MFWVSIIGDQIIALLRVILNILEKIIMSSVNKVILLGNLGRDPDIRSMQSGKKMAAFSIATSKRWKDRSTQEQKESRWSK